MDLRSATVFVFCWFICIVALIVMSGCEKDETGKAMLTPVDLIPDDNEISGWAGVGAYEEASDYDSLYALIDGAAEVYIDNGFVSAVFQQYASCSTEPACITSAVHLRIYDQGNEANARKIYDKVATGIGIPWDGAGTEARIDESALASYTIEFWQKNFFIQVVVEEKTDPALNVAKLFASHVSSKIG